ncbi:MAG: hypothetical protein ACFFBD_24875 [Candidatus Hodarchaeota archaeon]
MKALFIIALILCSLFCSVVNASAGDEIALRTPMTPNSPFIPDYLVWDYNDLEKGHGIVIDAWGSIYVVGDYRKEGDRYTQLLLVKLSATGQYLWSRTWRYTSQEDMQGDAIAVDNAGYITPWGLLGVTNLY